MLLGCIFMITVVIGYPGIQLCLMHTLRNKSLLQIVLHNILGNN